jgi:hypothetical protein
MKTLVYEIDIPDDAAIGVEELMRVFLDSTDRELVTAWRPREQDHRARSEGASPRGVIVVRHGDFEGLPWSRDLKLQFSGLFVAAAAHVERQGWEEVHRVLEEKGHDAAEELGTALSMAFAPTLWLNEPELAESLRDAFANLLNRPDLDLAASFPRTAAAIDFFTNTDNEVTPI